MREELLEKLDAFVETYGDRKVFVGVPFVGVAAAWAALRAELAAERCENCQHCVSRFDWSECAIHEYDVCSDDYCSHFDPKEPK